MPVGVLHRLGPKLLAGTASGAVAFVGAELSFRWYLERSYGRAVETYSNELYLLEPGTDHGFVLRPGAKRTNNIPGTAPPGGTDATWSFSIDDSGRRAIAARPDASDPFRVVALGDSYTFGWAVEDDEAYPSVLADELAGEGIEVVNAGVPGYSSAQEASFAAAHWEALDPDLVVLGFVMNDADPGRNAPIPPELRYRLASSWLWEELKLRMGLADGPLGCRIQRHRPVLEQFAEGAPERTQCRQGLEALARLCADRSVPLVMFVFPGVPKLRKSGYPYRSVHELVVQWGEELGVPTFDLLPLVEDQTNGDLIVPGDGHPNAETLRRFTEPIAAQVRAYAQR